MKTFREGFTSLETDTCTEKCRAHGCPGVQFWTVAVRLDREWLELGPEQQLERFLEKSKSELDRDKYMEKTGVHITPDKWQTEDGLEPVVWLIAFDPEWDTSTVPAGHEWPPRGWTSYHESKARL